MLAIAFDLLVAAADEHHPDGCRQAYADIASTLGRLGFDQLQASLYTTQNDDLVNLYNAVAALKALPWFPPAVGEVRGFKIDLWSDFTPLLKSDQPE